MKCFSLPKRKEKKGGRGGCMAELVDTIDLIQLNLGRKTYQVLVFRFKET
jgi:hypothetical protein